MEGRMRKREYRTRMTVGDKGKSQGEGTIKGKENNHWTGDWRGKVKQEREK